jgi:hypothetical protein
MQEYYRERRRQAIEYLGGKCVKCGSTDDLQFDHVDPKTKAVEISKSTLKKEVFWAEVKKCQLLCGKCHSEKSVVDVGNKPARSFHGTLSTYRYCKCEACKKAHSDYCRDYNKAHPRKKSNTAVSIKASGAAL